jgi:hypothetical protein
VVKPTYCPHHVDSRLHCLDCEHAGIVPVVHMIREGAIWVHNRTGERVKIIDNGTLKTDHVAFIEIGKELQALQIHEFRTAYYPLGQRPN